MSFEEPPPLQCVSTLGSNTLACEKRGELDSDRSNAILVCHGLHRSPGSYLLPSLAGEIAHYRFRHA
jgi:homoserine acetyltransferase